MPTLTCSHHNLILEGISEHHSATEIDQLHDALVIDHNIVQLEITMRQTHAVQVQHSTQNLQRRASNLLTTHLPSHDRRKQVVGRVLHHFVPLPPLIYYVDCLDDVAMVKSRANTKFRRDLLVVVLLALIGMTVSKLLHGEDHAVSRALHETD